MPRSVHIGISGGQSSSGQVFVGPLVFPCHYHSTDIPYSFIYHLTDGQWVH
jgi:hypothetical protein